MLLDGHVHMPAFTEGIPDRGAFLEQLAEAGIDGAVVISRKPNSLYHYPHGNTPRQNLGDLLEFCGESERLYPLFFIDPLEPDALAQVDHAMDRGVAGFKVVCNRFFPGDDVPMRVFSRIAAYNKPILFHTGILYDGFNPSTRYNRPGEYDALLQIEGLRFCLAHISWPWCDECIALFGKYQNGRRKHPNSRTRMYIDISPGTPPPWRKDALTKLMLFDEGIYDSVIFGTDGTTGPYDPSYAASILSRDQAILSDLGLYEAIRGKLYADNLLTFLCSNS